MIRLTKDEVLHRLTEQGSDPCVMCSLARAASPLRVAENEFAVAVLERFAARRGHVSVILRKHQERLEDLEKSQWLSLQEIAWHVARAQKKVLASRRTYVCALGCTTPRINSFPHLHIHVIPLSDGGDVDRPANVFTWEDGVLVYDEGEAETLAAQIRAAF